jgi:hypothetical protein
MDIIKSRPFIIVTGRWLDVRGSHIIGNNRKCLICEGGDILAACIAIRKLGGANQNPARVRDELCRSHDPRIEMQARKSPVRSNV